MQKQFNEGRKIFQQLVQEGLNIHIQKTNKQKPMPYTLYAIKIN